MRIPCAWLAIAALLVWSNGNLVNATPFERVANHTLTNLPAAPPTFGFTSVNALGSLVFTNPIGIMSPPGDSNRLFVLEKRGRIIVITNLAAPTRAVFLDLTDRVRTDDTLGDERGLLGLAFHPGYASNRQFFVLYTSTNAGTSSGLLHDILSRFETSAVNPNQGLPASEVRLLQQRDEASNHNGGDLHFGPDGYLYVSLGDEGGANDQYQNSQRINKDFFSGILRLDVDKRPGSLNPNPHPAVVTPTNYAVPPDNPFIGATSFNGLPVNPAQVRTEFWAVGLRNPWRMAFDELTGLLYCGDVGQNTREEINLIEKGRNYGWNYWEGFFQRTNSAQIPAGFGHAPPLIDYPRSLGVAVTGGRVYRGVNLSQLHGAYVYADYGSGRIWALRHNGTNVTQNSLFNFTDSGIAAFGVDPRNGDLLYADQGGASSTIRRIIYNANQTGPPVPATLAEVNGFADLATLTPHPGIVPYDLNVPFWSDNARKTRWFAVPNTNLTITFSREGNWLFPTGTVWFKHFELELTNGVSSSRKRLETRVLVKNATEGYGLTYRWGDSLTNATLVPEGGLDESFVINDSGVLRTQVWRYPSWVECRQCHTPAGGFALGFNTPQLNRDFDFDGTLTNQIAAYSQAGYFDLQVTNQHTLRSLAASFNSAASLEYRVRSYLAANCVQCHQPDGPAQGLWDARIHTPGPHAGLINGPLVSGGNSDQRVVTPGSLTNSELLRRVALRGPGQMPPLASSIVDWQAVALLSAWITNDLTAWQSFADWQMTAFGSTNAPAAGPEADFDGDRDSNYLEYLNGTVPTNAASFWSISARREGDIMEITFPQRANRGYELQSTSELAPGNAWTPVDVPANAPFFSASNRTATIQLPPAANQQHYRVRVFEP